MVELKVSFFQNVGFLFYTSVKKLEEAEITVIEVYELLKNLFEKMKTRISDSFYGFRTSQLLKKLPPDQRNALESEFVSFYKAVLEYTASRIDLSDNNVVNTIIILEANGILYIGPSKELPLHHNSCTILDSFNRMQ